MTRLSLTKAQAKRLGLYNSSIPAPQAPQKRRATTHPSPPPSVDSSRAGGVLLGNVGGTLHLFSWARKYDGWLARCGLGITVKHPDGGDVGIVCVRCFEEEEVTE